MVVSLRFKSWCLGKWTLLGFGSWGCWLDFYQNPWYFLWALNWLFRGLCLSVFNWSFIKNCGRFSEVWIDSKPKFSSPNQLHPYCITYNYSPYQPTNINFSCPDLHSKYLHPWSPETYCAPFAYQIIHTLEPNHSLVSPNELSHPLFICCQVIRWLTLGMTHTVINVFIFYYHFYYVWSRSTCNIFNLSYQGLQSFI